MLASINWHGWALARARGRCWLARLGLAMMLARWHGWAMADRAMPL